MSKIRKTLKDVLGFDTRKEIREMSEETKVKITNFLADNKKMIVIMLDPESDTIVAGFQQYLEAHRAVNKSTGKPEGIIANVLRYKKDDKTIADSINQVLLLIDGSLHGIARRLAGKEEKVETEKPTE